MRLKQRAALTLAVLSLLTSSAQARSLEAIRASGTIRIATEGAFPPFNMLKGTQVSGFEVDLGNALARQLGLKVHWTIQPFDNLLIGLNQDRYDLVIASHGITPERARAVDFSAPHYCTGGSIITRTGGPTSAAALKGKRVGVQVGTSYLTSVRQVAGVGDIKTYPKDTDVLAALMAGRVDAWVSDRFVGLDAVKAQAGKLVQGDLLFNEKIGMAVKKGNTSLLRELNAALGKMLSDGTYARISQGYFGQDIRCK